MRPHRPRWGDADAPRGPPAAIAPKGLKTSHLRPLGGGNFCPADAAHGFSRPASECRAGRSVAGVCQGENGHSVGRDDVCMFGSLKCYNGCKDTKKFVNYERLGR